MPKVPRDLTAVEPLASQEAAGFSKPRRLRDAADRRAVRRSAGNTPERHEYVTAQEFLRRSPEGDLSDYRRMRAWMAENPDGTVEDWTRLEASRGR